MIGDDVGGIAVHIGARVGATAGPGEVLVSGTVKDLVVGSGIAFEDRGERELKGVPGTLAAVRRGGLKAARPPPPRCGRRGPDRSELGFRARLRRELEGGGTVTLIVTAFDAPPTFSGSPGIRARNILAPAAPNARTNWNVESCLTVLTPTVCQSPSTPRRWR